MGNFTLLGGLPVSNSVGLGIPTEFPTDNNLNAEQNIKECQVFLFSFFNIEKQRILAIAKAQGRMGITPL